MKKFFAIASIIAILVSFASFVPSAQAASQVDTALSCYKGAYVGLVGVTSVRATANMPWEFPVTWKPVPVDNGRSSVGWETNQLHVDADGLNAYVYCQNGGMTYYVTISGNEARITRLFNASGQALGLRVNDHDFGVIPVGPFALNYTVSIYPRMAWLETYNPGTGKYDNIVVLAR